MYGRIVQLIVRKRMFNLFKKNKQQIIKIEIDYDKLAKALSEHQQKTEINYDKLEESFLSGIKKAKDLDLQKEIETHEKLHKKMIDDIGLIEIKDEDSKIQKYWKNVKNNFK